jgi:hypothetical protein
MKTQLIDPNFRHRCYEFCFPNLDTLVLVEENDELVLVRATRNTFSERRKIFFIRELAAEGFVSDEYRYVETISPTNYLPVRWLIDYSWLKPAAKALAARTRRIMVGMLGGATLLWLVMMGSLWLSGR